GVFDEQEHPLVPVTFPIPEPPPTFPIFPFPAAAQRTALDGPSFPVPFDFGWLYLDLNVLNSFPPPVQTPGPASDLFAAQGWVIAVQWAAGRFATGVEAYRLDSACDPSHFGQNLSSY